MKATVKTALSLLLCTALLAAGSLSTAHWHYPVRVKLTSSAPSSYKDAAENKNTGKGGETAEKTDADGQTVTDNRLMIEGEISTKGKTEKVEYEVRSAVDNYEVSSTGEVSAEDGRFSLDDTDVRLKPGENEIVIRTTLADGGVHEEKITQFYDAGTPYSPSKKEIVTENHLEYVDGIVDIYFDADVTDERADEVIKSIGGTRVGEVYGAGLYQAKVSVSGLDEIKKICVDAEKIDGVMLAQPEYIQQLETNTVEFPNLVYPDDPCYYNPAWGNYKWNEDLPNGGGNWAQEAVRAPSTWQFSDYLSNVKVGVVDSGFYTDHEDWADGLMLFPNAEYEANSVLSTDTARHGTHVAGLIGATRNNGIGIAGILSDVNIYGAKYTDSSGNATTAKIIQCVSDEVECGAKVVNLSVGFTYPLSEYTNPYDFITNPNNAQALADRVEPSAASCVAAMNSLLSQGYDFLVVQSAGNGVIDTRLVNSNGGVRAVDAYSNGMFSSVQKKAYGNISAVNAENCYNRIIIVGSAQNMTTEDGAAFRVSDFSNDGERVDIFAPGHTIFSTCSPAYASIPDSQGVYHEGTVYYIAASGTSQAAPIVTGIAGAIIAAADKVGVTLTAPQVKEIICDSANTEYEVYDNYDAFTGTPRVSGADTSLHPFYYYDADGNLLSGAKGRRMVSMYRCVTSVLEAYRPKGNYRYLQMYVNTAQSLNPSDYTNWDTVQAVIDSIDWNIKDYRQDKIRAKTEELLGALDGLQSAEPADYSRVYEAQALAESLDSSLYVSFTAVTRALNSVTEGLTADRQAEVDAMADAILAAIASLKYKTEFSSNNGDVIIDETNKLIVLSPDSVEDYTGSFSCLPAWTVAILPNANGNYSTGSAVTLTHDEIVLTYKVAVVGDYDGSGHADGADAFYVQLCVEGLIVPESPEYEVAADADCDGTIGPGDVDLLEQAGLEGDETVYNLYEAA